MDDDLVDREDVRTLVTSFYRQAYADPLIGPIFTEVARMDLAAHLPIMCDFWETALFHTGTYRRNILQVHMALDAQVELGRAHFDRWLTLWCTAVDERFAGPKAELAKLQAERIAGAMHRRLSGHRSQSAARPS
jgi:truncated hemoglobin YjbI